MTAPAPPRSPAPAPLRDAATVIAVRDPAGSPTLLMGRRARKAAFYPDHYVFPGGAIEASDIAAASALTGALPGPCLRRLATEAGPAPQTIAAAALRELTEETGLLLGAPGPAGDHPGWSPYRAAGLQPDAGRLSFVYRAITPAGQPRRFDARFFVTDAAHLSGDTEGFSAADGELSDLGWYPIDALRALDLPRVTRLVIERLVQLLPDLGTPPQVPLRQHVDGAHRITLID